MKFSYREKELSVLNGIYKICSKEYGSITVLTGRKRVGKTLLAREYAKDKKHLYFCTSRKAEPLLCAELKEIYERFTGKNIIGEVKSIPILFEQLLIYGKENPYVLIMDGFHEFYNINRSIYSDIQNLWDQYKFETKVHIIFISSNHSVINKIFQNPAEPLYGRADRFLDVKPFNGKSIKKILDNNNAYATESLFNIYAITGGVPGYVEVLVREKCLNLKDMINLIISKESFFINEGRHLLLDKFSKDSVTYFSILELISAGITERSRLESVLGKSIGGYLEKLESEYDIIKRIKPVNSRKDGRIQKYIIKDNFIRFWFRFIFKYWGLIEAGQFEALKKHVYRDMQLYSEPILKELIIKLRSDVKYGYVGTYWERGNQNKIDIVAINDMDKKIFFSDVSLNKEDINTENLKNGAEKLLKYYSTYDVIYEELSLDDIDDIIEEN